MGTTCRASADVCDVAELCSGSTASCPSDRVASGGTVCRPAAGSCDVPEACDGVTISCSRDLYASADTVCRPSTRECDATEACSGLLASCPPDESEPDGTSCLTCGMCRGGFCNQPSSCCGLGEADCDGNGSCESTCERMVCRYQVPMCLGVGYSCGPIMNMPNGTSCGVGLTCNNGICR